MEKFYIPAVYGGFKVNGYDKANTIFIHNPSYLYDSKSVFQ